MSFYRHHGEGDNAGRGRLAGSASTARREGDEARGSWSPTARYTATPSTTDTSGGWEGRWLRNDGQNQAVNNSCTGQAYLSSTPVAFSPVSFSILVLCEESRDFMSDTLV